MKAKKYLRQIYWLNHEIQCKEEYIQQLTQQAQGCSAPVNSGMPGGSSGVHDRMAEVVARLVDAKNEQTEQIDKLRSLRSTIAKQIDGLDDPRHRLILLERYILCYDWCDIADRECYAESHCYRIHREALAAFECKYLSDKESSK